MGVWFLLRVSMWVIITIFVTDRVRSTREFYFPSHPSICLSTGGGWYPSQVQLGGTQARSNWRVTPPGQGGTPPQVPLSDLARGVLHLRYPLSDLARGPPIRPGRWYPCWRVPHLGFPSPQSDLARGSTPARWVPHLGYPWSDLTGGYPCWGVPQLGYPWSDLAGGYPTSGNRWSTWYAAVGIAPCVHAGGLSCYFW